ncbi:unnamed protein product [Protopolystoma xenopodis]|uniref:Uncharacterized protein n=1 Tax=Protopolystoma xenopodis TaxID=117903 RepID=A0A448X4M5_9PLAT|nr:unnamed protein product [Protopolystoma xenopodis]
MRRAKTPIIPDLPLRGYLDVEPLLTTSQVQITHSNSFNTVSSCCHPSQEPLPCMDLGLSSSHLSSTRSKLLSKTDFTYFPIIESSEGTNVANFAPLIYQASEHHNFAVSQVSPNCAGVRLNL